MADSPQDRASAPVAAVETESGIYGQIDRDWLLLGKYEAFSVRDIIDVVALQTGVLAQIIRGKNRQAKFVMARVIVAYLARMRTEKSLRQIGVALGGRDYSTILYYVQRADNLLVSDKGFSDLLRRCDVNLMLSAARKVNRPRERELYVPRENAVETALRMAGV